MKIYDDLKWTGNIRKDNGVIREIILHHRAGNGDVESIDAYHKRLGWEGIGYHYYIRKNGDIFSGRPELMAGAHTKGHNIGTLGICFEGNFENETMSQAQIGAGWELIQDILQRYPGITVRRHKDLNQTACPGRNFPFDVLTGNYKPTKEDADMTKEDVMQIIAEHELEKANSSTYPEAATAMAKAKAKGLMDGTRPNSPLTRGEYAIIMDRKGELG